MAEDIKQYIVDKVEGSVTNTDPFPFLYIQDFFPTNFYNQLEKTFPSTSQLMDIIDKPYKPVTGNVTNRSTFSIYNRQIGYQEIKNYEHKQQCIDFRLLVHTVLIPSISNKLQITLPPDWHDDVRFVYDTGGYHKYPHTDHPKKIMSILIYMSYSRCGTVIVKPKQRDFSDSEGDHYPFENFDQIFDPPFIPNALIAFPRTNTSFHCVDNLDIDEQRKSIQISVWS